jgi:hypothetical protein
MKFICKELPGQSFETQDEMFKAIADNMESILIVRKNAFKETDGLTFYYIDEIKEDSVTKANNPVNTPDLTELKVKVVMNTIGLLDSHGDVHIKDMWKRSLSHSDRKLHLQEHKRDFDKVIADDSLAYVSTLSWKTLGAPYEGSTQALIFESVVKQTRNKEMFNQYKNGWVKNHSVGMQYSDIRYCMNSELDWAKEYKANWDKYYPMIANKEDADKRGYFTAVLEAKLVEGSAVLFGSNWISPTLDNNMKNDPESPSDKNETVDPSKDTQQPDEQKQLVNLNFY